MANKTTDDARKEKLPSGSKVTSTKESATKAYDEQLERVKKTEEFKNKYITNVFNPNFKLIDDTIEGIKKSVRKNGVDHYSCNNIYIILQDALKRVELSGN